MEEHFEAGSISDFHWNIINQHGNRFNNVLKMENDASYNYFELKSLKESYLFEIYKKTLHSIASKSWYCNSWQQHDSTIRTYKQKYLTHSLESKSDTKLQSQNIILRHDLFSAWNNQFEIMYLKHEVDGRFKCKVSANELWSVITHSHVDTGGPVLLYKTFRRKQFFSEKQSSIAPSRIINLSWLVRETLEFDKLKEITKTMTINLNAMFVTGR